MLKETHNGFERFKCSENEPRITAALIVLELQKENRTTKKIRMDAYLAMEITKRRGENGGKKKNKTRQQKRKT